MSNWPTLPNGIAVGLASVLALGASSTPAPGGNGGILLEDGTSFVLTEGGDFILLE